MRGILRPSILLAALLTASLHSYSKAPADVWSSGGKHPVALEANANCAECHGELTKGKFVHSAMSMGCTTCHTVSNDKQGTHISLVMPVTQICTMCHSLSTDKVLHGPYKNGDCVVCHSPHSTNFPQHTWADHQNTCLGCHARARLKNDPKKQTVTVPWGITLAYKQMEGWKYINLNKQLTQNHPVWDHPVSGPNTALGGDAPPLSCLSCHKAHASNFQAMVVDNPNVRGMWDCKFCGLCSKCHAAMFNPYQ